MKKFNEKHYSILGNEDDAQAEFAKKSKYGIIEIGILFGSTSKILSESNPNVQVYGIDPLIPDSMNKKLIGTKQKIKDNTAHLKNFNFINDYSYNVIDSWDKKFDYLFIDADHKYDGVKKDFEDWFLKLEKGGYVSLHDSAMNRKGPQYWPGPSQLADELIFDERLKYIKTVGTLTVFKKK